MADKKTFEKPKMEVIKLNSTVGLMAGSCPLNCLCDGHTNYD